MNRYPITLILDQSSTVTGYVVLQHDPSCDGVFGFNFKLIQHGTIDCTGGKNLFQRTDIFRTDLNEIILKFKPDEIVFENISNFVKKSADANRAQSAIDFIIDELILFHKLAKFTLYPQTVKLFVTGKGNATKDEVIKAIKGIYGNIRIRLNKKGDEDDNHADALAMALYWSANREQILSQPVKKKTKAK